MVPFGFEFSVTMLVHLDDESALDTSDGNPFDMNTEISSTESYILFRVTM
jgi:hypothetical protein